MFGSVARGDADGESGIDLLIVAQDLESPELHDRVDSLQADVRSWTGNDLQLVQHTLVSWRKLVREKSPLVEQLRSDGIALVGHPPALLLPGDSPAEGTSARSPETT